MSGPVSWWSEGLVDKNRLRAQARRIASMFAGMICGRGWEEKNPPILVAGRVAERMGGFGSGMSESKCAPAGWTRPA